MVSLVGETNAKTLGEASLYRLPPSSNSSRQRSMADRPLYTGTPRTSKRLRGQHDAEKARKSEELQRRTKSIRMVIQAHARGEEVLGEDGEKENMTKTATRVGMNVCNFRRRVRECRSNGYRSDYQGQSLSLLSITLCV